MDIKNLVEETGYMPRRKAACHGGEYCSPCPFCKEGNDRFIVHPKRHNQDGQYKGGRFACRVCGKYGDAISFLRDLYGLSYHEACIKLQINPKIQDYATGSRPYLPPQIAPEPPDLWKEKAKSFTQWAHKQLLRNIEGLNLVKARGFNDESISRFTLGLNPQTLFRDRPDWGLVPQIKEDGKTRKIWLPSGIVIPTFSADQPIKIKVRRSGWQEGDTLPKYIEISGSKQMLSIYGDSSLPCGLVLESELDALLVQQEAGDLIYCIALGGSTKPIDKQTSQLIEKTPLILFLPDFDIAGKKAWNRWKKLFPKIQRILTPYEKSAGDYFKAGENLRIWLQDSIEQACRKLKESSK